MNETETAQPGSTNDPTIVRSIDLDPRDWAWATWRPRTQLIRPEPKPFSLEDCTARLARVTTDNYGYHWNWQKAEIADSLTMAEASFWFTAMSDAAPNIKPKALAAELKMRTFPRPISLADLRKTIGDNGRMLHEHLIIPLATLIPLQQLAALLHDDAILGHWSSTSYFFAGFLKYVVPYASEEELEGLRKELRPCVTADQWPIGMSRPVNAFQLAACLGMSTELLRVVESWADDHFVTHHRDEHYQAPQYVVFGLGDERTVQFHMRRLKLRLRTPQQIHAWLACTEFAGLDYINVSMANKRLTEEMLTAFALVKAPEAAPFMLGLTLSCRWPTIARKWLEDNPQSSIPGLIQIAGKGSKLGEAATQFLRDMRRQGHQEFMERCLTKMIEARAARLRLEVLDESRNDKQFPAFDDTTTPPWLREALDQQPVKKFKPPDWLRPADLPYVVIGTQRLNDKQVLAVLSQLKTGNLREPPPLFTALKQYADRVSLDAFAWELFERWQQQGSPSKDKWALAAIGFLGSDASVLKLTPLIRAWPGQSQHQRAAFGLECLRAIGSETAMMQLNGIAQKIKFQSLKSKATACMEDIARERGLSRAELEDCIIPDCGLDEHGSRTFDFGPHRFSFALSKDLKPMVSDESGKLKSNLPKPGARDDAEKAKTAGASWNLLKKTLREVLKVQANRLERAMVTSRRWLKDRFESMLVRHPLLTHLVRRLVWGVYNESDNLLATFRVTDEQDYADARDQPFQLDEARNASIGIVHLAHLTGADAGAWGELFSEYEIISPFPQLGRTIYKLEPGEEARTEITRFNQYRVPGMIFSGILSRQGWMGGRLPFPGPDVTAVLETQGDYLDHQNVARCYFMEGSDLDALRPNFANAMKLGDVHPVVISETLRYLHALQGAAK